ncbi:MAG TPA: DUF1932 domain-containing protein [Anaerolineales bacterium]|nr:DUF1932 domain-containing protein [Anaerolineales bacterium]
MHITAQNIAILHPGQMGISIAANLQLSGHSIHWLSADRSAQTRRRAEEHELIAGASLANLCRQCSVIISVCPPHAADDVARQVADAGFHGLYIDANAIAPARSRQLADIIEGAGGSFVDGGIIGGPAWEPGTSLYLSGPRAQEAATLFTSGPLAVQVIDEEIGKASALKMCYAAYSKGSTALLAAALAAAEALDVRRHLEEKWTEDEEGFVAKAHNRTRRVSAKAWRFASEMAEIAATFEAANLPPGFHQAAEQLYQRLAHFKDRDEIPKLVEVLTALRKRD